jgi:hypothetical protein
MEANTKVLVALMVLTFVPSVLYAQTNDLNIELMHCTVRIEGPAAIPGKRAEGSVFFLSHPMTDSTNTGGTNWGWNLMVTAAHVLEEIKSDTAVLNLHKAVAGGYEKLPHSITIRKDGQPVWYKHPDADVAVMLASLSKDYVELVHFPPTFLLADDAMWDERFIHPGDEVFCLGFPLGFESSAAGFPILRNGRIGSFPLLPTKRTKTFLLDLRVFAGNSGGPVYFQFYGRRRFSDFKSPQVDCSGILGLVIQDISYVQNFESVFESTSRRDPLGLAVVVHASLIKEAVESLAAKLQKTGRP